MRTYKGQRDLGAGTRLVAAYKGQRYLCLVEAAEDGKRAYVLEDAGAAARRA